MKKIKHLMKLISIILLFTIPASCDLVNELIIIENAVNVGAVDVTITCDKLVNVTNVTDGNFDVTMANENNTSLEWVRIGAFQTDNPGLNGRIILANVTFNKTAGDNRDICSLIEITVTTLKDATPQGKPILPYTVEGCTIVVSAPPAATPTDSSDDKDSGGGGMIHTPTPAPIPSAFPAAPSVVATPAKEEMLANTTAPTPEKVTAFRTEPSSLPPPVLSPIAGIVIVVIAAILGVIRVIGITAQTRDETYAEAIASIKQAECMRAIAAIFGIVVVAVVAIIGILLM